MSLERYLVRRCDVYGPVQLRRHDVTVLAGVKGVVDCFFLGLIVFMGCSLACVHAWFF